MTCVKGAAALALAILLSATLVWAHTPAPAGVAPTSTSEIPADFKPSLNLFDYEKRVIDIPMRDGVKLHTVIVVPRGAHSFPMLLDRTPYNAEKRVKMDMPHLADAVGSTFDVAVQRGYIFVFQDVRGKYGSGGDYVMNRPVIGPLNPTNVDHTTDTYDTIDWLVKNVPESNGRVGMIGTSYDGFTVLMGLIHPHPALKAAVPINPMVDTWKGDDWFHNGAFRQEMMDYVYGQEATTKSSEDWFTFSHDDYENYLKAGSADDLGKTMGMDQLGFWKKLKAHPAYDAFWQGQAVDKLLVAQPLAVPTLYVGGLWDQEDIYGAVAAYEATEPKDKANDRNFLVLGPWFHGQANGDGSKLGPLNWDGDTGHWFRLHVMQPFLDANLKDGAPKADIAPVTAFETGTRVWKTYDSWPRSCESGCPAKSKPLYFAAGGALSFMAPKAGDAAFDEYVSDPAKPVPYRMRPILPTYAKDSTWRYWLEDDQRDYQTRPDVLTYETEVLTAPVQISGQTVVNLIAATTGTDSDWVVKLIDVYPGEVAADAALGGYQLAVAMDIFRGRYRTDPAHPAPIPSGVAETYRFALPTTNHVFLPGHRIMVQVQSSWFPLYDRNPQTFVDNIFLAKPQDYKKATQKVFHSPPLASFVDLPVVENAP
jgi:putative CocE/NonD family hydrolase